MSLNSLKKVTMLALGFASMISIQGCSHADLNRQIDEQMAQETDIHNQADLRNESSHLIETTPGLNADQRQRLAELKVKTSSQLAPLSQKSLKLRAVLIQDLITTSYNEDEVELIKVRLKDIGDQRLSVMFDAIKKANLILGRQAIDNRKIVDDVLFEGHGNKD